MLDELYEVMVAANEDLIDKFKNYLDASQYDSKKDFKKWLGELVKSQAQLESALAETKTKRAAVGKALDELMKALGPNLSANKAAVEKINHISSVMAVIHENMESIKVHVKKYKA